MDLIEGDLSNITLPIHLRLSVRVVIGLLAMGFGTADISAILLADRAEMVAFVRMLRASRHPIIYACVREGMPPHASAQLPDEKTVRCRRCGATVNRVPCPSCWMSDAGDEEEELDLPMSAPSAPTHYLPGTQEKIEVMRLRVSRWECPFHAKDGTFEVCPDA